MKNKQIPILYSCSFRHALITIITVWVWFNPAKKRGCGMSVERARSRLASANVGGWG